MPKCRECRYLIGKKSSVGIECMQADNQKKWNTLEEENIKAGKFFQKSLQDSRNHQARPAEDSRRRTMSDLINRADAIEAVAEEWLSEASAESPYVNDDDIGEYRKLAEELFEDVPSADADAYTRITGLVPDARPQMEHDREWIIGCIKHDGFIKTDRFDKANQIILNALSADAVHGWIPCSERLPDEGQGVIVTVDDNVYKIKVGSCIYSNGRFHSLYNDLTVTAWMPLPTPYKGGDDE